MESAMIPLQRAMICENCAVISELRNETCPYCKAEGCLISLPRILNPNPQLGQITYIFAGRSHGQPDRTA